jgi:hypothetical protein
MSDGDKRRAFTIEEGVKSIGIVVCAEGADTDFEFYAYDDRYAPLEGTLFASVGEAERAVRKFGAEHRVH